MRSMITIGTTTKSQLPPKESARKWKKESGRYRERKGECALDSFCVVALLAQHTSHHIVGKRQHSYAHYCLLVFIRDSHAICSNLQTQKKNASFLSYRMHKIYYTIIQNKIVFYVLFSPSFANYTKYKLIAKNALFRTNLYVQKKLGVGKMRGRAIFFVLRHLLAINWQIDITILFWKFHIKRSLECSHLFCVGVWEFDSKLMCVALFLRFLFHIWMPNVLY